MEMGEGANEQGKVKEHRREREGGEEREGDDKDKFTKKFRMMLRTLIQEKL